MMGRCRRYRRLAVSDAPDERARFEDHAARCPACLALRDQDAQLLDAARAWRESSPPPPAELEAAILAAVKREMRAPAEIRTMPRPGGFEAPAHRRPALRHAWALAAVLIVIVGAVVSWRAGLLPLGSGGDLERALEAVERTQVDYARAIAELETAARDVFVAARQPGFDARRAGILRAYAERLQHLDDVIAEVSGFLEQNPGHSGGHTVLLAAYKEKSEVLREVLALPVGIAL